MTDTTFEYPSSPASLFVTAAREAPKVVKWMWCPACWTQTDQVFDHNENEYEVWICLVCYRFHRETAK